MMKRISLSLTSASILAVLLSTNVFGASLKGVVQGLDDKPLSHANISLISGRQHFLQVTGAKGLYDFDHLTPGKYMISVEMKDMITFNSTVKITSSPKPQQYSVNLVPVTFEVYRFMPHADVSYL